MRNRAAAEYFFIDAAVIMPVVRHLEKWFLFMVVVLLSLFLGVLYEQTDSLWAAITAHFLIDFVLALHVRLKRGAEEGRE